MVHDEGQLTLWPSSDGQVQVPGFEKKPYLPSMLASNDIAARRDGAVASNAKIFLLVLRQESF